MKKGKLIVLSAPSGTGKTTITKKLLKKNPEWKFSVSATTRPPREGEVDGKDYIFMSKEKFEHYVKFGDFLEWEFVHGNRYGTLTDPLYDTLDGGEIMLLDIDVVGGKNVMEEFPDDTISIFIEPPGLNIAEQKITLEDRLRSRGDDQTTQIKNRLKRFETEMESKEYFDLQYINEDLKETVTLIEKDIKKRI
tara:strand:- start:3365 stop:3943 length:579 start_codon:yes stop_codon:yes gene_type:complete